MQRSAGVQMTAMTEEQLAPVLRVANTDASIDWYQRLGFAVDYEYSSGPAFSRTIVVLKRGELVLMLSNREEDARPDALVYMRVSDVEAIADEFDVEVKTSGIGSFIELRDLDGNRLRIGKLNVRPADLKESRR
jgi:catechol 2,3-dioxygenase-like lactoylglutathione lyase family enzyme